MDDLIAACAQGQLSGAELLANSILLFFAGHATSVGLIGNGLLALLQHPSQQDLLRAEPERMATAVEEMIRYDGPAQLVPRTAVDDLTLAGQPIVRGERVMLCLAAANRDPARFPEPDRFDMQRRPNPHLGFGHGLHLCIGAPLARLNARMTIGAIVQRRPHLEIGAAVQHTPGIAVREVSALPVRFG